MINIKYKLYENHKIGRWMQGPFFSVVMRLHYGVGAPTLPYKNQVEWELRRKFWGAGDA